GASAVPFLAGGAPGGAPSASGAWQASAPAGAGVDLQQMIDSVRATIEMAARQGVTQARIALQPQELGDIRIHLSQTADGLLARITADTPAAAQALAEGRGELHQSLSSLGVSLLRLDIGSLGQWEARDRGDRFSGRPDDPGASSRSAAPEEVESGEMVGETVPAGGPAGLAGGGLVDVLA
ncbi:MAG TPA: flagellar hook-length control protein FliK, partial [Patescibacteria group bacterium]|nr:flagellar hook-length control protein FliK [Patescibacteria group bacterium]